MPIHCLGLKNRFSFVRLVNSFGEALDYIPKRRESAEGQQ